MESMLHRHCARYIYVVPDGLRELMSDISREVLRSQPIDMYIFIADYLDALLITRENARVAARLVESLTEMAETTTIFLEETGMERIDIDNVVSIMHRTFGKTISLIQVKDQSLISDELEEVNIVQDIINETNLDPEKAEVAAKIIQQAYKKFKERKDRERQLMEGIIDWRVAARSAIKLYRKTGVTHEEAHRAATLIKAAYRGYYTRRMLRIYNLPPRTSLMPDFDIMQYSEVYGEASLDEYLDKDEVIEKPKAVKINYETVIPHVDFDTSELVVIKEEEDIQGQSRMLDKPSTTSEIVKYSMKSLFEAFKERTMSFEEEQEELIKEKSEKTKSEQQTDVTETVVVEKLNEAGVEAETNEKQMEDKQKLEKENVDENVEKPQLEETDPKDDIPEAKMEESAIVEIGNKVEEDVTEEAIIEDNVVVEKNIEGDTG